jgi:hypothetical protein
LEFESGERVEPTAALRGLLSKADTSVRRKGLLYCRLNFEGIKERKEISRTGRWNFKKAPDRFKATNTKLLKTA